MQTQMMDRVERKKDVDRDEAVTDTLTEKEKTTITNIYNNNNNNILAANWTTH